MTRFIVKVLLAVALVGFAFTVEAKGWVLDADTPEYMSISNKGDLGGVLVLACEKKTGQANLFYAKGGTALDFFMVRNFGDTTENHNTKLIIGSGLSSQQDIYYQILRNNEGFTVHGYELGSQKKWKDAIAQGRDPNLKMVITESFLASETVQILITQMSRSCKF